MSNNGVTMRTALMTDSTNIDISTVIVAHVITEFIRAHKLLVTEFTSIFL